MDKYSFYDLFDIDSLQKLMDSLSSTLQVGISIRSPEGERFTEDSNYCSFCKDVIKKSEIGRIRCEQSDIALCAYKPTSPFICHCQSAGLIDAAINIMIEDVHIANLLVGQVRLVEDELSEEKYREIARSLNLDEEEYLKNIRLIPQKTHDQFKNIITTLSLVAEQLSQLGYQNLQLKSMVSSLENKQLLHQQERHLWEQMAERDTLTGLFNRRKFDQTLEQYAAEKKAPLCLISADANYLKLTNDIFGHEGGDSILKSIGSIMGGLAKKDWLVARCGGDEFRVILPGTKLETAEDYCRRVSRNCEKDRSLSIPLSVALGVAEWNPAEESLEDCFSRADEQMYKNKQTIKQQQHLPNYIMERLYDRQILNKEVVEISQQMIYDFSLYLGQTKAEAEKLMLAIHYEDIGMAKLPEYFMIRGQSRTFDETEQIHQHVFHSHLIARQLEGLYNIADIILYTHENWDGNGYPKHLTGCAIPQESRIIRIVNNYAYWTVSTLVGTNLTKDEAKARLVKESGKMYDPDLISKFLKFLKKSPY